MSRATWLLCLIVGSVMVVGFLACGGPGSPSGFVGGPCSYTDTPGQATVVSVTSATTDTYNCKNDPVVVRFNFVPSDPLKGNALTDNNAALTVGDGANPPRTYITNKGFTVGSTHTCVRKNITSGTCSPLVFEFPTTDLSDYGAACF